MPAATAPRAASVWYHLWLCVPLMLVAGVAVALCGMDIIMFQPLV